MNIHLTNEASIAKVYIADLQIFNDIILFSITIL